LRLLAVTTSALDAQQVQRRRHLDVSAGHLDESLVATQDMVPACARRSLQHRDPGEVAAGCGRVVSGADLDISITRL
jgi:hypothetical protein